MIRLTFIAMSLLLVTSATRAQAKLDSAYIFVPDVQAQQGNILIIPVKANIFNIFYGVQFSMKWDSTMFSYLGVTDFGLNNIALDKSFGTTNISSGKLAFLWFDESQKGVAPIDNKTIFGLKLKVLGNNAKSNIKVTDDPSAIEVLNEKNLEMKYKVKTGVVSIGTAIATDDLYPVETKLYEAYPNPLSGGKATLRLDIAQETDVQIEFFDILGKNISYIKNKYNIGTHFVEIGKNQFPQAGAYVYKITTNYGETLSGKLIVE
jgi:hypothetical protein